MEVVAFQPDDREALATWVALTNAARRADSPWMHELTEHEADGELRYGWDLEPADPYLAVHDGVPVAAAVYETNVWDNHHLVWLRFDVHPDHRRRGHGSRVLEALVDRARAEGRRSVGTDAWDLPAATGFAARHGLPCRSREVNRRQHLADVDRDALDRLHRDAVARAAAYDVVRLDGPVPDADLDAYAAMVSAINDAPLDDLDIEDEVYTPARIRAYEEAQRLRGLRVRRLYARHRETGELAGETVVGVDTERPQLAHQHDTSVVRAHRGHRLGLLLKLEMLRWLAEEEPQVETVDTWNAESNDHMVAVNEALGYRVLGRALAFQWDVRQSTSRSTVAPSADTVTSSRADRNAGPPASSLP
jgi:GNAT superfamily N-acetyltransferase